VTLGTLYQRLLLVVGVLALSAYCTADGAVVLAALAIPGYVLGWWLSSRPERRLRFPRRIVNVCLGGAIGYALFRSLHSVHVTTIAELVIFIQLIKLGDRRGPRDDAQVLSLMVFLAIAAMLQSNTLLVGAQLIVFLPLLIAVIMVFHLAAGVSGAGEWPPVAGTGSGDPLLVRGLVRAVRVTVALSSIAVVLAAGGVFVIMPRGGGENVLGDWGGARRQGSATGYASHVRLGERGIISESPVAVMDVMVRDPAGHNLGNGQRVFYLRGGVLNDYSHGSWTPPAIGSVSYESDGGVLTFDDPRGPLIEQTVRMRMKIEPRGEFSRAFAVYRPVQMKLAQGEAFRVARDEHLLSVRSGGIAPAYTVWSAVAESGLEVEPRRGRPPAAPDVPGLKELAEQVVAAKGLQADPDRRPVSEDWQVATALQQYLQQNYAYTLEEAPVPEQADPVSQFLFTTKRGHCEYFATALVLLCRSVGVNARMVTGYVAAEYNESSSSYLVRQSNAHAWAEVEAGPGRWREFDATPPRDLERIHRPPPMLFKRVRQMFDAVEFAWNSSVVGFTESDRERLLGSGEEHSTGIAAFLDSLTRRLQRGGPRLFLGAIATGVIVFAVVSIMGFGISAAARLARRLHGRWRAGRQPKDPALGSRLRQVGFYGELLAELESRGVGKPAWRPPVAHADAIKGADPAAAAAMRTVAELYYRVRYGGADLTPEERAGAEGLVRALRGPVTA
jgi:transglutaminase-like putative cysteine protease